MNQLKMWWENKPLISTKMPEGYHLRTYREGDAAGWMNVCSEGLSTSAWTEEDFRKRMLEEEGIHPEGIFFVVADNGKIAGTATGVHKTDPEMGYLHMVSIHPGHRGKKLAKPLNARVLQYLAEQGRRKVTLDTDDFRIPAIKVYLSLGFRPIIHEADMLERWQKILLTAGYKEMEAYTLDGKPGPLITVP